MSPAIAFTSSILPCSISCFISSINSVFTSEKLLTKFKGFCISCAIPAVSSPSDANFSDCISRACVEVSSVNACSRASFWLVSSAVRSATCSSSSAFMAVIILFWRSSSCVFRRSFSSAFLCLLLIINRVIIQITAKDCATPNTLCHSL